MRAFHLLSGPTWPLFALALTLWGVPATADPPGAPRYSAEKAKPKVGPVLRSPALCASLKAHTAFLARRYKEYPVFSGQAAPGITFRLYANENTGSWTMLMVRHNSFSCVRGAGKNFRREVGT